MTARRTLWIVTQVYVPDPASLGQHMHDAAQELHRRGWRVVVVTAARGYDDPSVRYARRETIDGVLVRRLPLSSFGKRSIPVRVLGSLAFLLQAIAHGLGTRDLGAILVSTSPPMASLAALAVAAVRRAPITWWCMDLNPDQAIALGRVSARSLAARAFDALNRRILARARRVVAMDAFMAERLRAKRPGTEVDVVLPWPHEDAPADRDAPPAGGDAFRRAHGLLGKFVLMYSGNHSPAHPLDTILAAAKALEQRNDVAFVFVGGGLGKRAVDDAVAAGARNVTSLPYQPLATLRESLSAADVHLVTFGAAMVGVVHPCKAYGAMAVGRPLLLVGPRGSPIAALIERFDVGWRVGHGDVEGMVARIEALAGGGEAARGDLAARGERARAAIRAELSRETLRGRLCDLVEDAAGVASRPVPPPASRRTAPSGP